MNGAIDTRPVLTPERAGELLGLSLDVVRHLMDTGRIRSVDICRGGTKKFRRTSAAWLAEFQGRAASAPQTSRPSPVRGLEYSR